MKNDLLWLAGGAGIYWYASTGINIYRNTGNAILALLWPVSLLINVE